MFSLKFSRAPGWMGVSFLACGLAHAGVIYSNVMTIGAGDPTQLGRINRNSVLSDWSAPKAFPGTVNPTTAYHYTTVDLTGMLTAPFWT
jgi:hypothetical protein